MPIPGRAPHLRRRPKLLPKLVHVPAVAAAAAAAEAGPGGGDWVSLGNGGGGGGGGGGGVAALVGVEFGVDHRRRLENAKIRTREARTNSLKRVSNFKRVELSYESFGVDQRRRPPAAHACAESGPASAGPADEYYHIDKHCTNTIDAIDKCFTKKLDITTDAFNTVDNHYTDTTNIPSTHNMLILLTNLVRIELSTKKCNT